MNKKFFKFLVINVVTSVTILLFTTKEINSAPASYIRTCSNERLAFANNNIFLSARCLRRDGRSWSITQIELLGIINNNGTLYEHPLLGASTSLQSCRNFSIRRNFLRAECRAFDGYMYRTGVYLEEITNVDGNLQYEVEKIYRNTASLITDHSYMNHVEEFRTDLQSPSPTTFRTIAWTILKNPDSSKVISNGRKAYWKYIDPIYFLHGNRPRRLGVVVIVNGINPVQSTMFVPPRGYRYYLDQR